MGSTIDVDIYNKNCTVTTLAGSNISTASSSTKSRIPAFTLPEQTIRVISEELDEYDHVL